MEVVMKQKENESTRYTPRIGMVVVCMLAASIGSEAYSVGESSL
jgi:hypothetical protein